MLKHKVLSMLEVYLWTLTEFGYIQVHIEQIVSLQQTFAVDLSRGLNNRIKYVCFVVIIKVYSGSMPIFVLIYKISVLYTIM